MSLEEMDRIYSLPCPNCGHKIGHHSITGHCLCAPNLDPRFIRPDDRCNCGCSCNFLIRDVLEREQRAQIPDNVTLTARAATIQADLASGELSREQAQEYAAELIGIQYLLQRDGEALSDYGDAKAQAERWETPL